MKDKDVKEVFKYIHKTKTNILFGVGMILIGAIVLALFIVHISIPRPVKTIRIWVPIISICFCVGGFISIITEPKKRKKVLDMLEHGDKISISTDFFDAKPMFSDSIRVGKKYIFAANEDLVLRCEQIKSIALLRETEVSLRLVAFLEENEPQKICSISEETIKEYKSDLTTFEDTIKSNYPDVVFKY